MFVLQRASIDLFGLVDELDVAVHAVGKSGVALVVLGYADGGFDAADEIADVVLEQGGDLADTLVVELLQAVAELHGAGTELRYAFYQSGHAVLHGQDTVAERIGAGAELSGAVLEGRGAVTEGIGTGFQLGGAGAEL